MKREPITIIGNESFLDLTSTVLSQIDVETSTSEGKKDESTMTFYNDFDMVECEAMDSKWGKCVNDQECSTSKSLGQLKGKIVATKRNQTICLKKHKDIDEGQEDFVYNYEDSDES